MKKTILKFGWTLTRFGDRHGLRFLTYNPITWTFFYISGKRAGAVFSNAIHELYPEITSVLDVGAGTGGYVSGFLKKNIRSIGVEYSIIGRAIGKILGVTMLPFDCSVPEGNPALGRFDLVYSIEVGEHIPTCFSANFVDFITRHGDFVIFSSAFPGQGGHGHINEQPKEFWQSLFEERGFQKCGISELRIANRLNELGYRGWLSGNIQVFRKHPYDIKAPHPG